MRISVLFVFLLTLVLCRAATAQGGIILLNPSTPDDFGQSGFQTVFDSGFRSDLDALIREQGLGGSGFFYLHDPYLLDPTISGSVRRRGLTSPSGVARSEIKSSEFKQTAERPTGPATSMSSNQINAAPQSSQDVNTVALVNNKSEMATAVAKISRRSSGTEWKLVFSAIFLTTTFAYWASCGMIRVQLDECVRILHWSGRQELAVGPRRLFRPWPIYEVHRFMSAPQSCNVNRIQALTADGYRPEFSIYVMYSIEGPDALSARADPTTVIHSLVRSAFTQLVGEVTISTFVSRQKWISERVAESLEENLGRWGIELHSIEVACVGKISISSIRAALSGDDERTGGKALSAVG